MRQTIKKALGCVMAITLLASLVTTLYAESARTPAKSGSNANGLKLDTKGTPKNNATANNERKGDNRDDAKSGKIDRPGDGNSGQGDDKKDGLKDSRSDNKRPRHNPRICPICKQNLPPLPPKKQPPQTTKDKDNPGVRDKGQGDGRDGVGQGAENRKPVLPGKKWNKREDRRDQRENIKDKREDIQDRRENKRDNKYPPKRKWDAGDNRDDAKSGKIDRPGDGNSGQGNDKKLPPKKEGTDKAKIRPNEPQGDSSANTQNKRKDDNAKNGRINRPGDNSSGQGNDKNASIKPPHNPRTCPICNPKLKSDLKNRKPVMPKDKTNEGVRDGGKGEGRDSAGQGKGQGDTNKENNGNSKK